MTALPAAALEYARLGASVVPLHTPTPNGCTCDRDCESAGKHTRTAWKEYQSRPATNDEIRAWWTRWPDANVGIVCGVVSGFLVVDVDGRNGGFETLAELDEHGGQMPMDNPLVETGSLGLHHYFALDAPLPKASPFAGIDVQADGGLVVAPPSLHKSGRRYQWLRPFTARRTPVPEWLRWAVQQTTIPASRVPVRPLAGADADDVLAALGDRGLYLAPHRRRGLHRIRCPWADAHSNRDVEAVVIEPGASPAPGWGFKCQHAHCSGRTVGELLDVLGIARRKAS